MWRAAVARAGGRTPLGVPGLAGALTLMLALMVTSMTRIRIAAAEDLSSPAGLWQPIDSRTGKPLGLIRIYRQGDAWFGRIEPSPGDDPAERCTHCTDERRNQPISGLVLMRNLRQHDGEYTGGDILDPDTGRIYGCRFRLIDGGRQLVMRGYLGLSLLGRDQVWRRASGR